MKKKHFQILAIVLLLLFGGVYYYVALPAINIHEKGFWAFFIVLALIISVITVIRSAIKSSGFKNGRLEIAPSLFRDKRLRIFPAITLVLILIFIVGSILSSSMINAKKYRQLIDIQNGDFSKDIEQISYQEIPLLDKDSAQLIGNRKMGSMVEYISQFEVADDYTQINYKGTPYRVTPLNYGSILKWFANYKKGIPAYISIDMASTDASCTKLKKRIMYSESDHFGRNIHRYLRFRYPTHMFADLNFEIDDEGTPYWICPVRDYTIGLFGGETIQSVVLVNAVTGDHKEYSIKKVPSWVDRVYSAELLISYYDYYGTLKHGYWNSVLSQKDCLKTTDGYNYIALNDDVWVYTGVTSVGGDESNVGFVLMNQRTGETKYYSITGAEEYSAMSSAEGKVQNLGYKATFPLLLNIAGEPTYFICLKDSGGLVKQYAMVNIEKYTIVATGTTVTACEKDYLAQMKNNHVELTQETPDTLETTGIVKKVVQTVEEGNTHFYFLLEGSEDVYEVTTEDIKEEELINVIRINIGDTISLKYTKSSHKNSVTAITSITAPLS